MLEGSRGCFVCVLCQKRLRLTRKVDECKPLPTMTHITKKAVAPHPAVAAQVEIESSV